MIAQGGPAVRHGLGGVPNRPSRIHGGTRTEAPHAGLTKESPSHAGLVAGRLAHSVRNPLTSIKMRLFSLSRLDLPPDPQDDLRVIADEISSIERLVEDYLRLSRPRTPEAETVSPSEVVDKAVGLLRPSLESRCVGLVVARSCRLPPVSVDPDQLKEALTNLIVNASEAVRRSGGRVTVREEDIDQSPWGRVAAIHVHDNGEGIHRETLDKVFHPFFTTRDHGTGLGLCISRQLVEANGGTLTVRSSRERGTTFTVRFPIRSKERL